MDRKTDENAIIIQSNRKYEDICGELRDKEAMVSQELAKLKKLLQENNLVLNGLTEDLANTVKLADYNELEKRFIKVQNDLNIYQQKYKYTDEEIASRDDKIR